MDSNYVFLCGVIWRNFQSDEARSELMRAMDSNDPDIAWMAYAMLESQMAHA